MFQKIFNGLVTAVLGTLVLAVLMHQHASQGFGTAMFEQTKWVGQYFSVGSEEQFHVDANGTVSLSGGMVVSPNTISATSTLTAVDFGSTNFLTAASGTTVTLPAATAGAFLRFVVASAFDTANVVIDSAEGDNIEGTLAVNGGVVACSGEDQVNFVASAETVGDFVELVSDGSSWYLGATMGSTTGSITCTDPS